MMSGALREEYKLQECEIKLYVLRPMLPLHYKLGNALTKVPNQSINNDLSVTCGGCGVN